MLLFQLVPSSMVCLVTMYVVYGRFGYSLVVPQTLALVAISRFLVKFGSQVILDKNNLRFYRYPIDQRSAISQHKGRHER